MKRGVLLVVVLLVLLTGALAAPPPPPPVPSFGGGTTDTTPSEDEVVEQPTQELAATDLPPEPPAIGSVVETTEVYTLTAQELQTIVQQQQIEIDSLRNSLDEQSIGLPSWVYVASILAILQFFALLFFIIKDMVTPDTTNDKLKTYIRACKDKQLSKDQVTAALRQAGYPEKRIDDVLKHY